MGGRDLLLGELTLLGGILARRDPDLVDVVERIGIRPISDGERDRVRRAVVDELCELPDGNAERRALELEELLIHLGNV